MKKYKIAFFTADWNYDLVESTLHGLKRFVDEREDVSLCVFDCFGKDIGNARDMSEYSVFELADLNRFDGLLIQGNQIVLGPVRDAIARRVAEAKIPALSIDCAVEGCALLGIDNRAAQREIVEHLIRAHGARRLVYLTGIMDNGSFEGRLRMEGFLDACRENGIDPGDTEVIGCTWRTDDGVRTAERWVREKLPLPDAFVCGNDEMALGLMEELEKHGYRVPRDVMVTGFDGITSAELSTPRLSTVNRDYDRMNYTALERLIAMIDGTETRDFIPFDYGVVCSESCGCGESERPAYIRDKYFQQTRILKNFYTLQDKMASELFDASDLRELMDVVEKNNRIFGTENMFLCVNEQYFDSYDKNQWSRDTERFDREMVLAACGMAGYTADEKHVYARFPTPELLPGRIMAAERFLIFYPLHYNTYSIGYFVMDSISHAAKLNLHESIFSFLEIAIENVRKKGLLRQLNEVLDNLYVRDALTGLYNRFGFERFAQRTFDALLAEDGGAMVLFVDMDDMKGINDRYGHEVGDAAIKAAAQVLKDHCAPRDFVMRYGGDEFLVIASRREEGLQAALADALADGRYDGELPCRLGLSVGVVLCDRQDERSLEACIQDADAQMYQRKKRRKAGR